MGSYETCAVMSGGAMLWMRFEEAMSALRVCPRYLSPVGLRSEVFTFGKCEKEKRQPFICAVALFIDRLWGLW